MYTHIFIYIYKYEHISRGVGGGAHVSEEAETGLGERLEEHRRHHSRPPLAPRPPAATLYC